MTEHHSTGFGETLRRRREQKGLSLNDVAVRTRIRKTYLQALEDENLTMLPGSAYAVGFLKIYAKHLDLDAEPMIATLTGKSVPENEPADGEGNVAVQRGKVRGGKPRSGNPLWFLLLFVVLVVFGGGSLFYLQNHSDIPAPVPPIAPPVEPMAPPAPVLPPASLQPPVPEATGAPAVEMVELPVLPPEGAIVRIVASHAVVIKVSLDGQESRSYEMQPEQQLNWKVGSQLQLEFSAPTVIRCWVDEQEIFLDEHVAVNLVPASSAKVPNQ